MLNQHFPKFSFIDFLLKTFSNKDQLGLDIPQNLYFVNNYERNIVKNLTK